MFISLLIRIFQQNIAGVNLNNFNNGDLDYKIHVNNLKIHMTDNEPRELNQTLYINNKKGCMNVSIN